MLGRLLCRLGLMARPQETDPRLEEVLVRLTTTLNKHNAEMEWLAEQLEQTRAPYPFRRMRR